MKKYITIFIITHLLCLLIGFFIGRSQIETKTKTEYIKGETISDTIYSQKLIPFKEEKPEKSVLPTKLDTIRINDTVFIRSVVDTAAIINDYEMKRFYNPILFDDNTNGKLAVNFSVQYNRMQSLSYDFTPIYKVNTIRIEHVWNPFVSASYSSFGYVGIGAGTFYHDIGFEIQYQTDFNRKGILAGLKYRF